MLNFDLPKNQSSIIKVIGVGGGGSNAVTHMFHQGINGVDFMICNTDAQAMESSPVPNKIQLGVNLTGGLGAGAVPNVGKNAALENIAEIRAALEKSTRTKMLFITAGLGGGTGTGAAPVIASVARELEILTVAIVTIPFSFEGRKRRQHAEEGIAELRKYVDAVLIIRNDKLRELYGNLTLRAAFGHADDVLTTAAKGIAELITVTGYINVDFEDVKTVMKDSGVALMGVGIASGEERASSAIEQAMSSPLLSDDNVEGANNILLFITSGKDEIKMDEVTEITEYIQRKTKSSTEVIWGNGYDESLEDKICVTLIATGFDAAHRKKMEPLEKSHKIVHNLDEAPKIVEDKAPINGNDEMVMIKKPLKGNLPVIDASPEIVFPETREEEPVVREQEVVFDFSTEEKVPDERVLEMPLSVKEDMDEPTGLIQPAEEEVASSPVNASEEPDEHYPLADHTWLQDQRKQRLRDLSVHLKNQTPLETNLNEIESVPAYKRRNVTLNHVTPSSEPTVPKFNVGSTGDNDNPIGENSFLSQNQPD